VLGNPYGTGNRKHFEIPRVVSIEPETNSR
jgi:hypothetical protein